MIRQMIWPLEPVVGAWRELSSFARCRACVLLGSIALACGPSHVGVSGFAPNDTAVKDSEPNPIPGATTPAIEKLGKDLCTFVDGPDFQLFGANLASLSDKGSIDLTAGPVARSAFLSWHVCNDSKSSTLASGTTYALSAFTVQPDPTSSTTVIQTPISVPALNTINVPALPSCACFMEVVAINTTVPAAAKTQGSIASLSNVQFPEITLPPSAANQKYFFTLPASSGVQPATPFSL